MSEETNALFWEAILKTCMDLCDRVQVRQLQDFSTLQVIEKADGSLVTESDRWSDQTLREGLLTAFPQHGVLSEETVHLFPDNEWCWIIDPLDGTTNFARGIPLWGISIALLHRGTPVFGFVRIPILQQSFYGYWAPELNSESTLASNLDRYRTPLFEAMPIGAYRNSQAIKVSSDSPSRNHFFNLCARSTGVLKNPLPAKIRMLGVATYNVLTIAQGSALGGVEATPKIWDIAATWVIVQAAGGVWTSLSDRPDFPLAIGENYCDRPFPCLVTSSAAVRLVFEPLVR